MWVAFISGKVLFPTDQHDNAACVVRLGTENNVDLHHLGELLNRSVQELLTKYPSTQINSITIRKEAL